MQYLFRHPMLGAAAAAVAILSAGRAWPAEYDIVLRSGTIYDGSGKMPFVGDVALRGDRIAAVGDLSADHGKTEIRAAGLAVAPGFINMMCWANETLIADGRSQSDIRQGVTLEVMGEGDSMGPLNDRMKKQMLKRQGDIKYAIEWTTLGEYLQFLERRGVSANVASFIGAATPRNYVIGEDNRPPTADELKRMQDLVRQAMREGAMGVASALIYPPGSFAKTDEIIALSKAAAEYDGLYASHMRSEGAEIIEGVQELLTIARKAKIRAEIYHLKTAGRENWPKMEQVIAMVEKARSQGLHITADMYTYPAGSTGLDSTMPPWVEDGGFDACLRRLKDPATRKRDRRRDARLKPRLGEHVPGARIAGRNPAGGLQEREAEAADGQDPGRKSPRCGEVCRRDRHGPHRRGRQPHRDDLLHAIRGAPAKKGRAAVGQFLFGCRVVGARGRFPEIERASAGLRQLRPRAGQVRPRRES